MYQSRIIIHLLAPQGLLKRLLKLCIKDITRVLRRLLFSTVLIAWQARCVCLCGCPSALVSMPATSGPAISSFNSTEIISNYFIGCWLKRKKKGQVFMLCWVLAWMFCLLLEKCDWPFVAEDVGQVQRVPLSISAMLLVGQRGPTSQQRWCVSLSFTPQHLPVATRSRVIAEEPFVMLLITKTFH